MTIWFISDTHFDHTSMWKVFKLPGGEPARAFSSDEEMNETIIARWNAKVKPSDHIYHLGDVTMARGKAWQHIDIIMSRLNGHKRICLGNHDQLQSVWYFKWFEKVKAVNVLDNILFTHIPIHVQNMGRFAACVHGHTHHNVIELSPHHPDARYINVCVEKTGYAPIAFEEIQAIIRRQKEKL